MTRKQGLQDIGVVRSVCSLRGAFAAVRSRRGVFAERLGAALDLAQQHLLHAVVGLFAQHE